MNKISSSLSQNRLLLHFSSSGGVISFLLSSGGLRSVWGLKAQDKILKPSSFLWPSPPPSSPTCIPVRFRKRFVCDGVIDVSVTITDMSAASVGRNIRQRVTQAVLPKWIPQSSLISTSAAAFSTLPKKEQEKRQRSTWLKMLLFIPGAITFGLGTWQIFRRQDKIKMLDYRQSRLALEPLKGNEIVGSTSSMDPTEFRKVQCRGLFDEKNSIYVGPRSRSISGVTENGYYVVTPLMPVPGDPQSIKSPILVNRGWVPRSWRDKALNTVEDLKESVEPVDVIGVARGSEKPSIFVPSNDPNASQWFYVDVPAIACDCGLPETTLYLEEINEHVNPRSPYPIQKDHHMLIRTPTMPQDHLNYLMTWYTLSAAVTFMAVKRLKPRKSAR